LKRGKKFDSFWDKSVVLNQGDRIGKPTSKISYRL
jgi:hypothetical protein